MLGRKRSQTSQKLDTGFNIAVKPVWGQYVIASPLFDIILFQFHGYLHFDDSLIMSCFDIWLLEEILKPLSPVVASRHYRRK
jgi:hypothetical protein